MNFSYNSCLNWLEQSALVSENREHVDDIQLPFKILLWKFDKVNSNL